MTNIYISTITMTNEFIKENIPSPDEILNNTISINGVPVLVDQCSNLNIISEEMVDKLGLKIKYETKDEVNESNEFVKKEFARLELEIYTIKNYLVNISKQQNNSYHLFDITPKQMNNSVERYYDQVKNYALAFDCQNSIESLFISGLNERCRLLASRVWKPMNLDELVVKLTDIEEMLRLLPTDTK